MLRDIVASSDGSIDGDSDGSSHIVSVLARGAPADHLLIVEASTLQSGTSQPGSIQTESTGQAASADTAAVPDLGSDRYAPGFFSPVLESYAASAHESASDLGAAWEGQSGGSLDLFAGSGMAIMPYDSLPAEGVPDHYFLEAAVSDSPGFVTGVAVPFAGFDSVLDTGVGAGLGTFFDALIESGADQFHSWTLSPAEDVAVAAPAAFDYSTKFADVHDAFLI